MLLAIFLQGSLQVTRDPQVTYGVGINFICSLIDPPLNHKSHIRGY